MDFGVLNLDDLRYFVRAVEGGSFTAAARRLGCPKSTVSKRVAELEGRLGARLIQRTSRRFALTDVGLSVYEHARAAVIEAEAAEEAVRSRMAEPSGTVRITASVPTAQSHLADVLPRLAQRYPKIRLQLHVTDHFVDLVQEGFDIAVRSHRTPLPDSDLVQRQLAVDPLVLVAAPGYVAGRPQVTMPEDLGAWDGLFAGPGARSWDLGRMDGGPTVPVSPLPRLYADESQVLLRAAEAGLGVTALDRTVVAQALSRGRLVEVLPGWTAGTVTTTLLLPHRRGQLPAVRATVEVLCRTGRVQDSS